MDGTPRIPDSEESIQTPDTSQDEAFARYLQEEEDRAIAASMEDPDRIVPIMERNISEAKKDPKHIEQQAKIDENQSSNHGAEDIEAIEKIFLERSSSGNDEPDSSHGQVVSESREDNRSDEVQQSAIDDENVAVEASAAVQQHPDPAVSAGENQDLRLNSVEERLIATESRLAEFEIHLSELRRAMERLHTAREG